MKIGVFADVGNLYYCIGKRYENRKLDYSIYLESTVKQNELHKAFAYGTQVKDEASGFILCLKRLGYIPIFKSVGDTKRRVCWDASIAMDIVKTIDAIDVVVIGSSNPDLVPVVEYVKSKGKVCQVIACGISKDMKAAADSYIEIPEEWLEELK